MAALRKGEHESHEPVLDDQMLRIIELVECSWLAVAAAAWRGYQLTGRGFLMLDFAADFDRDEQLYVAAERAASLVSSDPQWNVVVRNCEEYDPKHEVTLVFRRFVGCDAITSLRLATPDALPTPPDAYRQFVHN